MSRVSRLCPNLTGNLDVALMEDVGGYADVRTRRIDVDQAGIVTIIDEALERFASRDLIGSSEVVDFLLDLRSAVVSDAALAALIESETEPAH
jgi:hypothetical protein